MYECMYVCVYVCMYVCMYVGTYVWMYLRIYVCMYVCTYECIYLCVYVRMYVRMDVFIYVHMYVCMYLFIYLSQIGIYNCDKNRATEHFVASSLEFESQPCQPKRKDHLIVIYIKLIVATLVQTVLGPVFLDKRKTLAPFWYNNI